MSKPRSECSLDRLLPEPSPRQVPSGADAGSPALDQPGSTLRLPGQARDGPRHELLRQAFLREHPDVCQSILARIQTELGLEQVASARLLPVADAAAQNGKVEGDPKAVQKAASR